MNGSEQRIFQARRGELQPALAFVEDFCQCQGVAAGDSLRLMLVVEELFTNTLVHGHRGDSDLPVHIELSAGAAHLALHYEDGAPPFDPLQYLAKLPSSQARPVEELEPGGQGLPLVAQISERFDYARVDGRNRLTLLIPREA